ncbi:Protein-disulfide isomerase [Devosia lucknowensis]|uniref:Protein-disulfide isomerase n=1 Tax=Devosia lucknowensis TaxID=1096929 RepID=A0A1Y6F104_9HYPH|nr:thioredoxin domain-containing protein [Devosia lucknowensis]SMQ68545.1 Protein-disulfide isomerase [Devosia lucknowensis]
MNKRLLVIGVAIVAIAVFAAAAWLYRPAPAPDASVVVGTLEEAGYVRAHSPVIGPAEAPVTITEFFDPSCEACRAYYPIVKQIMDRHPDDVRLVLRYAAFHEGSDTAVKIIEAARLQDLFLPVLEALLARQPEWAVHGAPNLDLAWQIAGEAGLDVELARQDVLRPAMVAVLNADTADVELLGVQQTPTFFVNGKSPDSPDPQALADLVASEVAAAE